MSDQSDGLPDGVASAMFLRDGWPDAVVCKVVMIGGCVGVAVVRPSPGTRFDDPALADDLALRAAIGRVGKAPPDYTEIHEHMAKMKAAAEARGRVKQ